jgi:hypothetical protein
MVIARAAVRNLELSVPNDDKSLADADRAAPPDVGAHGGDDRFRPLGERHPLAGRRNLGRDIQRRNPESVSCSCLDIIGGRYAGLGWF